jgi:hypothetical protein
MMEKSALPVRVTGACSPPPPFAPVPSRTKLLCTLQLRGQIHSLYFICCYMPKPCTHAQGRRTTRCVCSAWRRGCAFTRCTVTVGPSLLSSSIVLTFEQDCCYMAKPYTHAQGRRTTHCACSAWRRGWASTRSTDTVGPSQLSSLILLTFEQDCCYMAKPDTHAQGRRTTRCACSAWRRGWESTRCMDTAGPSPLSSSIVLTFEQDCCYIAKPCTHA